MKSILLFSLVCLFGVLGYAHESNEAFFKIIQKENTIEVNAEFPWTMRNALLAFNPALENANHKKDFEKAFVDYIKANLILKDKNGDILPYLSYKELENSGHSHQNNYLIVFKGSNLFEITNTIMFSMYDDQVNYHTINAKQKTFQTKNGLTHFKLDVNRKNNYWYFSLLVLPLLYYSNRYLNRSASTTN